MTDTTYTETYITKKNFTLWQKLLCRFADRIKVGSLRLEFANGRSYTVTGDLPGPAAELIVRNARVLRRLVTDGDLGFARCYIDGDWDSPDIGAFLALGAANEATLNSIIYAPTLWSPIDYWRHRLRSNTKKGSRKNIAYHYDLGNDFYRHWLDETMTYSSALYTREDATLTDAQRAKYDRIVEVLDIKAGDHVLEIGCGWGGFAEYAIAKTGCHVTGLTLSKEQHRFATERLSKAGFADKADMRIEDYRDCQGQFDKVVSIEMFEAVGEEHWPIYFETVEARLKPGGQAMIQTITIEDHRFEHYRNNADFIQTYIFPGGMLPSVDRFKSGAEEAGFVMKDLFGFGKDYARTLLTWDQDFTSKWEVIRHHGFDERFYRMWRYYLHYCAVGFNAGTIDVFQFHMQKDG